jgi:hypothetical protein
MDQEGGGMTHQETHPFEIGKAYFIRTITYHLTGRVKRIVGDFLVLEEAAWIADSGRFMNALKEGKLSEIEPMPDGTIVSLHAITDASPWNHKLPQKQK